MKHIKTPLKLGDLGEIRDAEAELLFRSARDLEWAQDVAADIVQAVNAYDALVAACQAWIAWAEQEVTEYEDGSIVLPSVTAQLARTRAALEAANVEL